MEAQKLADQLFDKFGSHRKVAELLLVNEVSYYKVGTGRAKPSKRLVQAMKNLLDVPGSAESGDSRVNRKPIPKEIWDKLKPK